MAEAGTGRAWRVSRRSKEQNFPLGVGSVQGPGAKQLAGMPLVLGLRDP